MAFSQFLHISSIKFLTLLLALQSWSINAELCFNKSKGAENRTFDMNDLALPPISLLNATGSVSFPGFAYPGEPTSNWTLSTGLYYDNKSTTASPSPSPEGAIWLNTNPSQNLSSPDLPYYGCAFLFSTNDPQKSKGSSANNNTCNGVISQKCFDHLISTAHEAALQLIGRNDTDDLCGKIADAKEKDWTSTCSGEIGTSQFNSVIFGNDSLSSLADNPGPSCSNNIGNGSPESAWMFKTGGTLPGQDALEQYKEDLTAAVPLLLVGWAKDKSGNNGESGWAEERLVCLTPDVVAPGSLGSSAARMMGWSAWSVVLCGLVAASLI